MSTRIGDFQLGIDQPFCLIAGPCVIENESLVMEIATHMKEICGQLSIPYVFKASFDKANRSSHTSYRGPGLEKGLAILQKVKDELNIPVLTDVHTSTPLDEVIDVVDWLQTPAFLCRQTDFIQRVAATGMPVNIKKGQFLSPWDMVHVVDKARAMGNEQIMVCERGVSFGYNELVADMRSLSVMRQSNSPVIFDVTHSCQQPGGRGNASGGLRKMIPVLARAGIAAGVSGLFMETHPDPQKALSDGPNSMPLSMMQPLLETLKQLDHCVKSARLLEDDLNND